MQMIDSIADELDIYIYELCVVVFYQGYCFYIHRQQQQLERVKKWLQLRNRDTDHRTQVEERRRKREEEAKVFYSF
jgi:hypothetical protein